MLGNRAMFRGKRIDYGEWVYGYLIGDDVIVGNIVEFNDEYFNTSFWYKVRPETVGQLTGIYDKNGKEIYEGDAVHCAISSADRTHFIRDYTAIVEQDICNPTFVLKQKNGEVEYDFIMCNLMFLEVIGNIHEHPNFIKEAV